MKTLREKKRWLGIVAVWLVAMVVLTMVAPTAKEVTTPAKNSGLPDNALSIEAKQMIKEYFPSSDGAPLFVVMHDEAGFDTAKYEKTIATVEKLVDETTLDATVIPLSKMPEQAWKGFTSENGKTFFIPVTFTGELEGKVVKAELDKMKAEADATLGTTDVYFTGPVGIVADAYEMFTKADVVLMISTVVVILVLLIVIYRSPLLAFIPLVGAGIVYMVVDRVIGLVGGAGIIAIDGQALSIMLILLFAVVTDYSLLIFSRFREELEKDLSSTEAMKNAIKHVREPIIFSGSTVMLGMLTLFFAVFEIYRVFAPVFAIAVAFIFLAGLTLIPALFALAGAKAFWPFNPRVAKNKPKKEGIWHRIARFVTNKPVLSMVPVIVLLVVCTLNINSMKYTFNLLDSFPDEMSSIQGYHQLEDSFSKGDIAPTTMIVKAKETLTEDKLQNVITVMEQQEGIHTVTMQGGGNAISKEDDHVAKLNVILAENPYSEVAFDQIEAIQENSASIMKEAALTDATLYIAGETAEQADIRATSKSDMLRVGIIMSILIAVMLGFQTRSLIAPIYMMATIILSFGAALGITVFVFQDILGYAGVSYRTPIYAFVFLVALGVDYSIMLMARIREEQKHLPLKEAVLEGVGKTGGVISSAGLILAATFAVLMTQPVLDLRVFGFSVFIGVLIDTFLVRTIVIPAIIVLLGKWSFWPKKQ